jgi:pathogenesis-related protein 1
MKTLAQCMTAAGVAALAVVGVAGTTSAAPTSATRVAALSPADQQQILALHNQYRAEVGAPPVQWDSTLAANSQAVADQALATNRGQHSTNVVGENIGNRGSSDAASLNPTQAVQSWYSEKSGYVPGTPGGSHYTQMVSKRVQKIGCAQAVGPAGNGDYPGSTQMWLVCQYSPQGNDGQPPY